jgi:hypothetical protein
MLDGSFDSYALIWAERLAQATGNSVTFNRSDIAQTASIHRTFGALKPAATRMLGFFLGTDSAADLPNPDLARVLNPFPRFFAVPTVAQLAEPTPTQLATLIERMHVLGIVSHLLLFKHPARDKITYLTTTALVADVLEAAGIADSVLKSYNSRANGAPASVAREQYAREVSPYLKNVLSIGFWKAGKIASHFQNFFWVGALLGVRAETLASQL